MNRLIIEPLAIEHALALGELFATDGEAYLKHFSPFELSASGVVDALSCARKDGYWIISLDERLAGFFMLRGFDQGYEIPSFGVYVARWASNRGLSKIALAFAVGQCRELGCPALRLSVHPDNAVALAAYETAGFRFSGTFSPKGHRIYQKSL